MKKSLLLIALLTSVLIFGCKKDSANINTGDTSPKIVQIVFINDNIQSQAVYLLNEHPHSVIALNGADNSSKESVQVKIGNKISIEMFTTLNITSNYSIKILYGDKQIAYSADAVFYSNNNHILLDHTFTDLDFK